ncbi:hypothetical protein SeMB42_g03540 [Synchytrium endobioticum]|uniref:Uncharacterized protein n=1 Tax=Synchytrium endobioticum TaxID=286115 RepID=A0A507D625_9FUNG|nr:hypothetical protein SeMB42_g03540 [Synchytrium endobioticum]
MRPLFIATRATNLRRKGEFLLSGIVSQEVNLYGPHVGSREVQKDDTGATNTSHDQSITAFSSIDFRYYTGYHWKSR